MPRRSAPYQQIATKLAELQNGNNARRVFVGKVADPNDANTTPYVWVMENSAGKLSHQNMAAEDIAAVETMLAAETREFAVYPDQLEIQIYQNGMVQGFTSLMVQEVGTPRPIYFQ